MSFLFALFLFLLSNSVFSCFIMGDLYNYWKSQKPDSLRAVLEKVESCFEGGEGAGGCGLTQLSGGISSLFRGTCDFPLPPCKYSKCSYSSPTLCFCALFAPGEQSPSNRSCHPDARFLCRGPQPGLLSD